MSSHNQTSFKPGHIPLNKKHDVCTVSGCGSKHEALGYCVKHYKRFKKTGSPFTPTSRDDRLPIVVGNDFFIPLGVAGKDGFAAISQNDYWLANFKWYKSNSGYAVTRIDGRLIMMHRLILGEPKDGVIDHKNRDRIDNRRENLHIVTPQENSLNTGLRNTNTSGYKGVSWSRAANKWGARITRNGESKHLGLFSNIEDAAEAYIRAAESY